MCTWTFAKTLARKKYISPFQNKTLAETNCIPKGLRKGNPFHGPFAQLSFPTHLPQGRKKVTTCCHQNWCNYVFPSIKFPSIHIAPPTAAKGSKTGISTPGVEVRNIPVTKPTNKIPTLRESTGITTVTTIDDYIVYSPILVMHMKYAIKLMCRLRCTSAHVSSQQKQVQQNVFALWHRSS